MYRQSPLHFAAFKKKPEVAALLLAHPACDPFVLDRKQGRTPAEDPPAEDTSDDAIRAAVVAAQEAVPLRADGGDDTPNFSLHSRLSLPRW